MFVQVTTDAGKKIAVNTNHVIRFEQEGDETLRIYYYDGTSELLKLSFESATAKFNK